MRSAITFDFHNTLIHCDEWFDLEVRDLPAKVGAALSLTDDHAVTDAYRALRREVMEHGIEMDAVAGVVEAWRRTGVDLDDQTVQPIIDDLMRSLVPSSTVVPGATELLDDLRTWGIPIGVVSSAVHDAFLRWSLGYHGLLDAFSDVLSSAAAGYYKSRPEIYQIAYERLGADPGASVHIGDSFSYDHLTASRVGTGTIWLNTTGEPPPGNQPMPTAQVSSMDEVGKLLEALLLNGQDRASDAD
jgi:HAD superfamily hydrolase (TIGR01549 family)